MMWMRDASAGTAVKPLFLSINARGEGSVGCFDKSTSRQALSRLFFDPFWE